MNQFHPSVLSGHTRTGPQDNQDQGPRTRTEGPGGHSKWTRPGHRTFCPGGYGIQKGAATERFAHEGDM
jgi:hypothetical protein